jgi:hypothetical protein
VSERAAARDELILRHLRWDTDDLDVMPDHLKDHIAGLLAAHES